MKVLVCHPGPNFSVADVYNGWAKGLAQAGARVGLYSLDRRLNLYGNAKLERDGEYIAAFDFEGAVDLAMRGIEGACYEYDPDVVLFVSGFYINERLCALIRRHRTKIAILHTESPYEDDRQIIRAAWADVNVVNDPTNIDRYPPGTVYLPHCYDPDIHYPRDPEPDKQTDFFFCGTGYQSRLDLFENVDWTGINVKLAGNWTHIPAGSPIERLLVSGTDYCMDNTMTAAWYASTLTSVNLYRREANEPQLVEGWACGPREIELAACGIWFARDARGESDLLFPMLPTFTDARELEELIRWAICNPEPRDDASLKAYEAVSDRSFANSAGRFLELLGL